MKKPVIDAKDFDFGDYEPEFVDPPSASQPPAKPRLGKYIVIHEGMGPPLADGFEELDEAIAFAKKLWGGGYVGIEMPDGTAYDFGETWGMRERINLIRMRLGPLDPRQQLLLEKWEEHPKLRDCVKSLTKYATTPINMYEFLEDNSVARQLLIEAMSCGLLEIVDWTDGWPFPDREWVDKYIEAGRARSI